MKKTLLLLSIICSIQHAFSQCSTQASNFGNNQDITAYNVSGNVTVSLNANNTVSLNLGDNFTTAAGPDIRAFLVNSNGASDDVLKNSLIDNLENIQFGLVGCISCGLSQNGAKSFTVDIPEGVVIENYDKIFFYCLEFNQFWDFGSFTPFSDTNCSVLSVEENTLSKLSIYPNPANDIIQISGLADESVEISIFNTLGKIVFQQKENLNQDINISEIKSGLYILRVSINGSNTTRKLVVE